MIEPVREWLPGGLVSTERINAALSDCLGGWRADWLARPAASIGIRQSGPLPAHALEHAAQFSGPRHIRLALPAIGKRYLLEALLDEPLAGKEMTPADHRLLDDLTGRAMENLAERFDGLFPKGEFEASERQDLAIHIDDHEICRLSCPMDGMILLVRQGFPRAKPLAMPLTSRRQAIKACPVDVDAFVGRVKLTVDDLHDLEIGDVLVLDRQHDQAIELRLAATGSIIASGRPAVLEDRNAITF